MNRQSFLNRRTARIGARIALSVGAFAAIAGIYAFQSLSARPGEGALALVPASAGAVASIDLSPSASQAIAFKHIEAALDRAGWNGMEGSILDLFESGTAGIEGLRPLVLRNGAVALLPGSDGTMKNPSPLVLISLKDGKAAQEILIKSGAPRYLKGVKYFKLKNGKSCLMVVDDLLLVAQTPDAFYVANQVRSGALPSIVTDAGFKSAGASVAEDANVKVFVSAKAMEGFVPDKDGTMTHTLKDWLTFGLAIRDGGIGLSYASTFDVQKNPDLAKFGQIPPIRSDLFKVLPSGAYGAYVASDISGYFDATRSMLERNKDVNKGLTEMKDSVRKGVGMDFDLDILPALRGTAVIAAYPNEQTAGVDALIVLDDSNGGEPSRAIERFQSWVQSQAEKEGNVHGPLWNETAKNNARMFKISDEIESDFRKGMSNDPHDRTVDQQALFGKKTIAWAMVGKSVIASTSQELLDRAVANFQSKGAGLDVDPKFASHEAELLNGSQQLMVLSLSRIATGVRNTVHPQGDAEELKMFDKILKVFEGLDQPLTLHGQMSADGHAYGGTFIPLDYDKTIDTIYGFSKDKK